jgi:hypothetical protein
MSRHVVVGTPRPSGRDAVAFAARLARRQGPCSTCRSCLPSADRSVITPAATATRVLQQAQQWIAEAIDRIPADVVAHAQIRRRVVRGGPRDRRRAGCGVHRGRRRRRRLARRHRLGSTTTELLHSSDVPVVLVPRGRARSRPRRASPG